MYTLRVREHKNIDIKPKKFVQKGIIVNNVYELHKFNYLFVN